MIPEVPNTFHPGSLEDVMFEALKGLPEAFLVFHSFRTTDVKSGMIHESETDFIILHKEKGIACLEAKAGAVSYRDGSWLYGNGQPMRSGGPYKQAAANKWKLMERIGNSRLGSLTERIRFLHAVWFPSLSDEQIGNLTMPPEADPAITWGKEALADPLPYAERLFSLNVQSGVDTTLSDREFRELVREVLCPQFNIFPPVGFDIDLKHSVFHRMLGEQSGILNFLTEQRSAVINGAAGTGKTLIAVEKARRHALNGESVLFLCYNSELKKYLTRQYENSDIHFMTLDGYVCKICGTAVSNYAKAKEKLKDYAAFCSFPYDHVIVDEGQDFGRDGIENAEILELLHDAVLADAELKSSFYVFYDELQSVQADWIPKFILNAECRFTLHRNCRNTENISETAVSLLKKSGKPTFLLTAGVLTGKIPCIHFCEDISVSLSVLDEILAGLERDGIGDIVILTLRTEDESFLSKYTADGTYKGFQFTTCRKFKGLEADAVVLVDFTERTVLKDDMLFYVGASRARVQLDIMTMVDNESCKRVVEQAGGTGRRPMRDLASALKCTARVHHKGE